MSNIYERLSREYDSESERLILQAKRLVMHYVRDHHLMSVKPREVITITFNTLYGHWRAKMRVLNLDDIVFNIVYNHDTSIIHVEVLKKIHSFEFPNTEE